MSGGLEIRQTTAADLAAIEDLYRQAFPEEDLLPVVHGLLGVEAGVTSLCGIEDGQLAGHCVFTMCAISGSETLVALLGPLAVLPQLQRQGIGSALIAHGVEQVRLQGAAAVLVLGDPAYYGRFGFAAGHEVAAPYDLPDEWHDAWQIMLLDHAAAGISGTLVVPEPWRREKLWAE